MLGVGMQEIIIIFIVALIVIGPKKLPELARALGRAMAEFRRAADDLKKDLDINGVREAKEKLLQDLQKPQPPRATAGKKDHGHQPGEKEKEGYDTND